MHTYENRVTCFLDILGFREKIHSTTTGRPHDDARAIEQVAGALLLFHGSLGVGKAHFSQSKRVTQFSDSVVVSFVANEESEVFFTLLDILNLLIDLVGAHTICRGGIAVGSLIHTDNLLFGPALVEAYDMEKLAAVYPRVVLGSSVIATGAQHHAPHHSPDDEKEYIREIARKDSDGLYYVDYIEAAFSELNHPDTDYPAYLGELRRLAVSGLGSTNPGVRAKYMWVGERYNEALEGMRRSCRVGSITDPELRQLYLDVLAPIEL